MTRLDRIKSSIHRSFAREQYIKSMLSKNSIETKVWPVDAEYVMEYYIGTPPVRTYSILDTGSTLTWLQCLPCERCFNQTKVPIYDPAASSTYYYLSCRDPECYRMAKNRRCGADSRCVYAIHFVDGSHSVGEVAEETLHFHDGVEHNVSIDSVAIGCGHDNAEHLEREGTPGVIGLGRGDASIISQFGFGRFSYCFGDYDDVDATGYAMFGDAASITGYQTPIQYVENYSSYYLQLEGISVGDTKLPVPGDAFTLKGNNVGGVIIDSGTTHTRLNRTAFDILVEDLDSKMKRLKRVFIRFFDLCYEAGWDDMEFAPLITLHFAGADLQLPLQNTWQKLADLHCLAMFPTEDVSMLGNYQQQNINVGYDLENNVLSFDAMDCSN